MNDDDLLAYLADLTEKTRMAIRDADERDGNFYPAFDAQCASRLIELDRPDMPTIHTTKRLNKIGLRARLMLLACWDEIDEAGQDPILVKLSEIAPYIDQSWDGEAPYSPSELIMFRYLIAVTDSENPVRISAMKQQAIGWIEEARTRWRNGFYANPIGQPVARPI
jgi:hypothetical protein